MNNELEKIHSTLLVHYTLKIEMENRCMHTSVESFRRVVAMVFIYIYKPKQCAAGGLKKKEKGNSIICDNIVLNQVSRV